MSAVKPVPTTAPSAYGLQSYAPMSSQTNQMASNYHAPMSSQSGQLNAAGASWYSGSPSNIVQTPYVKPYVPPSNNQPQGQVKGASTQQDPNANLQNQQGTGLDLIEQDYNRITTALGNQESGLRSQADIANQTIDQQAGETNTALSNEQAVGIQGQNAQVQTAESGAKNAFQQARDLFRQTQQQNNAQLSALGISSSSVTEALAERLGVETARRIAGVGDSLQTIRQNAVQEIGRIKDYVAGKMSDVAKQVEIQKANIQQGLIAGLNQINSARDQAATDKARSRADLISQTQKYIYDLTAQKQQFDQALQQWQAQKAAALTPIVTDPTALLQYQQGINNINAQPGITQTYLGNYGADKNGNIGYMPGQLTPVKKPSDNPFDPNSQYEQWKQYDLTH